MAGNMRSLQGDSVQVDYVIAIPLDDTLDVNTTVTNISAALMNVPLNHIEHLLLNMTSESTGSNPYLLNITNHVVEIPIWNSATVTTTLITTAPPGIQSFLTPVNIVLFPVLLFAAASLLVCGCILYRRRHGKGNEVNGNDNEEEDNNTVYNV